MQRFGHGNYRLGGAACSQNLVRTTWAWPSAAACHKTFLGAARTREARFNPVARHVCVGGHLALPLDFVSDDRVQQGEKQVRRVEVCIFADVARSGEGGFCGLQLLTCLPAFCLVFRGVQPRLCPVEN